MTAITPANALKLAAWLAHEHPDIFRTVLKQVTTARKVAGKLVPSAGLAGLQIPGYGPSFGSFGDDLATIDVSAGSVDYAAPDAGISLDPTLSAVGSMDASLGSVDLGSALSSASDTATSGGFWSTLGSDLTSVGGSLVSGVGTVAGALLAPSTLSAVGNAASSYFKSQAQTSSTQAQQAVLMAQLNRTANGNAPAPISYTRNSAGQLVPTYYLSAGAVPVTSQLLSSLTTSGSILPYVLLGGGVLLAAFLMTRSTPRTSARGPY